MDLSIGQREDRAVPRWSAWRRLLGCVLLLIGLVTTGCATAPAIFTPKGRAASEINQLWWLLLILGTLVFLGVMGYLAFALYRRPPTTALQSPLSPPLRTNSRMVVWGGIVLPITVLSVVYGATIETLRSLASVRTPTPLTIVITGHQWWWEVEYPEQGFVTANEVRIPVGEPVQIQLATADVIHSFWVPQLHGKLDMIPGQTNTFWLEASEPGEYWGLCAEFCGIQHANMLFVVVAEEEAAFADWLAGQQRPAQSPTAAVAVEGEALFWTAGCDQCHAIAGTPASGRLGPDLTHLMSRRTLAAGILENNIGTLGGWIANPQHVKPGNLMPASSLSGAELQALLAYLMTLE